MSYDTLRRRGVEWFGGEGGADFNAGESSNPI